MVDIVSGEWDNSRKIGAMQNSLYGSSDATSGRSAYIDNIGGLTNKAWAGPLLVKDLYGENLGGTAQDAQAYAQRVREGINKGSNLARNTAMQQARNTNIAQKKAGLKGVDTTGLQSEIYRKMASEEKVQDQNYRDDALARYGKNISGRISGASSIISGFEGINVASQQAPNVNYGGGISVICTELRHQELISIHTYGKTTLFGLSLPAEQMIGYHILARPVVKLMRVSPFFASLWVGWALSLAANKPSWVTTQMLKVCGFVGRLVCKKTVEA